MFIYIFFAQILNKDVYRVIDKIKTVGSTYMAAVGLIPEHQIPVYNNFLLKLHLL